MRTLYRSALGWFLLLGTSAILAGVLYSACRPHPKPEPGVTSRPAAEVFLSFRAAFRGRDLDAFEAAVVDISGRRLLAGMSRDEIVAALGNSYSVQWTPLDPKKGDSDPITMFLSKKASYFVYDFYDPHAEEMAGFGLAFDGKRLAWSDFARKKDLEVKRYIFTDYSNLPASVPSSRPPTSEPSTRPGG